MNEELISICIPAYNAVNFIADTLQSVKNQTYQNWEVIVVEDGTEDGTEKIVNDFKKQIAQNVIYFRQKVNLGLSATRNTCVSFSKGKWIALLDSDDLWYPDHLTTLMATATAHPDCALIHGEVIVFDSQTGATLPSQPLAQQAIERLPVSLFEGDYAIQPSTIVIKLEVYRLVGGFTPTLRYVEDKDMWFKYARAGNKFAFTGKVSCSYRKHSGALSAQSEKMAIAMAQVYSSYADWEEIPKSIRLQKASDSWLSAARIVRRSNKDLAKQYFRESIKYQKTLKHFGFWILLHLS